jgi:hypothetical protein
MYTQYIYIAIWLYIVVLIYYNLSAKKNIKQVISHYFSRCLLFYLFGVYCSNVWTRCSSKRASRCVQTVLKKFEIVILFKCWLYRLIDIDQLSCNIYIYIIEIVCLIRYILSRYLSMLQPLPRPVNSCYLWVGFGASELVLGWTYNQIP